MTAALLEWDRAYRRTHGMVLGACARYLRPMAGHLAPGGTVVDCSTGTGLLLRALAPHLRGARLIGLDHDPEALAVARALTLGQPLTFVRADAHRWPFPPQSVDWVVAKSASGYWRHPPQVIAEIARCVKRGGLATFCEPNGHHPIMRGYRRWRLERLCFTGLATDGLENFRDTERYLSGEALAALLTQAGAARCASHPLLGGLFHATMAEF